MTEPAHLTVTRAAYDTVAADYAIQLRDSLAASPFDRAMLSAFAEQVGTGPVADLGCGPGRITAHLRSLGVDAFGVDLSPGMISVARASYPDIRFDEGTITALDLPSGGLRGVVAWYSIIHTPRPLLPVVFAAFHRVLAPGGQVLLAFQVGDERKTITSAYGHAVTCEAYRLPVDLVEELLVEAGFELRARMIREAAGKETTPQAYLFGQRTAQRL
ncbi:class I SAM-dependent DNA methyltransferase [Actinokineospora xionganensis]|uniref:Class I SAM-dependent methyltransferase n=1 Tax=Actinokineospora xionganensis TaxID=2684470 RepID=A0ABR7LE68_9PSEU|nr:class I SAM-dependent methyltransferase [Actinokineospora xionganensis]MBC6450607.1 class I SAM-dependent methyltransferase [Actinokineospora xionganensis]